MSSPGPLGEIEVRRALTAGFAERAPEAIPHTLRLSVAAIGSIKAVYPAAMGRSAATHRSVKRPLGRKWFIAGGMIVQAGGIWLTVQVPVYKAWIIGALLQGIGTAMVYPTLLAAISDVAHPEWRASAMGAYRFWRDLGYALGALISGVIADLLGMRAAIQVVAVLTLLSGLHVAIRMRETHPAASRQNVAAVSRVVD